MVVEERAALRLPRRHLGAHGRRLLAARRAHGSRRGRAFDTRTRKAPATLLLAALLLLAGCASRPPSATAQRSSFATDAVTTPDGTLELELGAGVGPVTDRELVTAVKYGYGPRTELFVCTMPWMRARVDGEVRVGRAATGLGWRHRFAESERGADGVQLLLLPPDGSEREGFASGETDAFLAGILDRRGEHLAWTLFYQLGSLGAEGSGRDTQHALAAVLGAPLTERVDGFLEVFGTATRARSDYPLAAQLGVAWNESPALIYDAAVQVGLNDDGGGNRVFFGVTWNLGRVRAGDG